MNKLMHAGEIRIPTEEEYVVPRKQIGILGWQMNSRISMDSNLDVAATQVGASLAAMEDVKKYMTEKTRLIYVNSYLLSNFLSGESQAVKNRYHRFKMKLARWVKQPYCMKTSITKICRSIHLETPNQDIKTETAKLMQRIMITRRPTQIINLIRTQRTRSNAKIALKYKKRNEFFQRNWMFQGESLYNKIPTKLKAMPMKKKTSWR